MSEKKKGGRPKKQKETRERLLQLHLTDKEYKKLEELVSITDSTTSAELIRTVIFGYEQNMKVYEKTYSLPYVATFIKHYGELFSMHSGFCEGLFDLYEKYHPDTFKRMLIVKDIMAKKDMNQIIHDIAMIEHDEDSAIVKMMRDEIEKEKQAERDHEEDLQEMFRKYGDGEDKKE